MDSKLTVTSIKDTHLAIACDRTLPLDIRRKAYECYEDEAWFQAALEGLKGIPVRTFRRIERRLIEAGCLRAYPAR